MVTKGALNRKDIKGILGLLRQVPVKGHELRVATSKIANSGLGLFLERKNLTVGQIVALYPGRVHPAPNVLNAIAFSDVLADMGVEASDRTYQISTSCRWGHHRNGGYIDGAFGCGGHAFAHGQRIQHPPQGVEPNVETMEFAWSDIIGGSGGDDGEGMGEDRELWKAVWRVNHLAPDSEIWYVDPDTFEPVPHLAYPSGDPCDRLVGICFKALRPLKVGDELMFDYRLGPVAAKLNDDWYRPVSR